MIRNGKFCKYHGNEFKVNRDSDGNTIILTKNGSITKLMGFRMPHIINSAHINEF